MMITTLLASCLISALPEAERLALLGTFREEFVQITPGKEKFPPASLPQSFFIAKYEVPQNLWEAVMGENSSRWKGPRNSVEMLSYDDAVEFCRRATEQLRAAKLIEPTQAVRLPTADEWAYCTRAGTTTRYSFGDDAKQLDDYAWHMGNTKGNDPPVGAKKPNAWGLYDVHGYLWDWCAAPTDDAKTAILCGGSWKDAADRLTSDSRREADRRLRDDAVGLRCVLE